MFIGVLIERKGFFHKYIMMHQYYIGHDPMELL